MNIEGVQLIYEYNYWASKQILDAAAKITEEQFVAPGDYPFGGLRGTLVHVIDAEFGWRGLFENHNLQNFSDDLKAEDFPTFKSLADRFQLEQKSMLAYINRLKDEDMTSHVNYTTGEGVKRDRILWHCLLHVVNHGTQHRAEAAAILTSMGASPGDLDFTVFLNETGRS
jgi:uncharacterized damage-inducible protein DinB